MSTIKLPIAQVAVERVTAVPVNIALKRLSPEFTPQELDSMQELPSRKTEAPASQKEEDFSGYQRLANQMNQMVQLLNKSYEFSVDKETNQLVIRVMDSETGELLHQMPPEELLKLVSQMDEVMGMFLDEVA